MKFAVFALIAALCLVSANTASISQELSSDYVEIQSQTFWKPMFWTFSKVLRTAKYLHCSINVVFKMERSTEAYIAKLHSCSVQFTKQVEDVAVSLKQVVDITHSILNINSEICNYPNPSEVLLVEPEGNQEPEELFTKFGCFWKLLKQFDNLEHQTVAAMKLVLALPKDGSAIGECMVNATNDLTTTYGTFNDQIKGCTVAKKN